MFKITNIKTVQGYQGPMDIGEIDCSGDYMLKLLAVWVTKHYNAGLGDGKKVMKRWPYFTLYDATSMLDWESYNPIEEYACIYAGEEGTDPLAPYIKASPALSEKLALLTPYAEIAMCALHKELVHCMFDEDVLDVHFVNWEA
jgi:hypothetical protein